MTRKSPGYYNRILANLYKKVKCLDAKGFTMSANRIRSRICRLKKRIENLKDE